jgi:hypothetical protein
MLGASIGYRQMHNKYYSPAAWAPAARATTAAATAVKRIMIGVSREEVGKELGECGRLDLTRGIKITSRAAFIPKKRPYRRYPTSPIKSGHGLNKFSPKEKSKRKT